jgi:hypothetical protein
MTEETTPTTADETGLQLVFTGKVALVVESNWGPVEFSANDVDLATELVRLLLGEDKGTLTNVDSYSEEDEATMKKMLGRIND